MVEPAVLAQRGHGTEHDADHRADHPGDQHQHRRIDQLGLDVTPDRLAVDQRVTEVAGEQTGEPEPVPVEQAPVEVQSHLQAAQRHRVCFGRAPENRVGRVAGQDLGGREHPRGDN